MNKIRPLLIALCFFAFVTTAHGTTINDEFNRPDSTDIGASYDPGYTSALPCQILSNTVQAQASGDVCLESWNANTFSNNQWAQITVNFNALSGNTMRIGIFVRGTAPSTFTQYRVKARFNDSSATRLDKVIGGANTVLATESATTWTSGDVLYLEVSGTSLTVKRNGVVLLTATDPDLASGRIGLEVDGSSPATDTFADSFSGGDLAVAATHRKVGAMVFQ